MDLGTSFHNDSVYGPSGFGELKRLHPREVSDGLLLRQSSSALWGLRGSIGYLKDHGT